MKHILSALLVLSLVFAVALAAVIAGCTDIVSGPAGPEVTAEFDDAYAADANTVLSVVNTNGRVSITSREGDTIILSAVKKTRFGAEQLDMVEITAERSGNELTIEAASLSGISTIIPPRVTVDMNISVPKDVIVDSVALSNGEITVDGVRGDVSVSCSNGRVTMTDVDGYVAARVMNGNINIRNTTGVGGGGLEVANGNIVADIHAIAGDTTIKNTNGRITVGIDPALNANLEMRTTNGEISVSGVEPTTITRTDNKTYLEGVLGDGGDTLTIVTTNGDVEVLGL